VKPVATFYKPTNLEVCWPASVLFFSFCIGIFLFSPSFSAQHGKTHSVLDTMSPEQVPGEMHCTLQENLLNNKT